MKIAPDNLAERLNQLYRAEPEAAIELLRSLVRETVSLVETNMPDVDTSKARRSLTREFNTWTPSA